MRQPHQMFNLDHINADIIQFSQNNAKKFRKFYFFVYFGLDFDMETERFKTFF